MNADRYSVIQLTGRPHLTVTQAENRREPMLSKCANPGCSQPFRYLGEGRLFQVERNIIPKVGVNRSAKLSTIGFATGARERCGSEFWKTRRS